MRRGPRLLPDEVIANGTDGADAIAVAGASGDVVVTGLPAVVWITAPRPPATGCGSTAWAAPTTLDDSALAPDTIGLSFTQ